MEAEEIIPELSVKEQILAQKRNVNRSKRILERQQKKLEHEEKKMLLEIKKMSKKGQTIGAKMLAKDIIRVRNQIKQLGQFIGQLNAVSMRISSCYILNELGDAMNNAAKAMTLVSNKLDTQKLLSIAKILSKEEMKIEMKQEMISEVMDSIGESMDNEEEQEELYNQVLAEAGVKIEREMVGPNKELIKENEINNESKKEIVRDNNGIGDDLDIMLKSLNGN